PRVPYPPPSRGRRLCPLARPFGEAPQARRHLRPSPTRRSSDLHVALGIGREAQERVEVLGVAHLPVADIATRGTRGGHVRRAAEDRKSTRLHSSHVKISYAAFCLKKKQLLLACSATPPRADPPP